jgi:hypothetical protein
MVQLRDFVVVVENFIERDANAKEREFLEGFL